MEEKLEKMLALIIEQNWEILDRMMKNQPIMVGLSDLKKELKQRAEKSFNTMPESITR